MMTRLLVVLTLLVAALEPSQASEEPVRSRVLDTARWAIAVLETEAPHFDQGTRAAIAFEVAEAAEQHHLEPALLLGVIKVESRFQPAAKSPKGARGLMQMMPRVARQISGGEVGAEALFDPAVSIQLGAALLRQLLDQYDGNLAQALVAYNMGPARLRALMRRTDLPPERFRYPRAVLSATEEIATGYGGTVMLAVSDEILGTVAD